MKSKVWLIVWSFLVILYMGFWGGWVYKVDPFFHYHQPNTEKYYYNLYNQRSQNNGISKNFSYNALITGTSMTENFKTSEMDEIFECNSVKVPYSGGTYKEINDNLAIALKSNPDLKIIVRGLDMAKFFDDKDLMRTDLGDYPTYLYDENIFNDVKYLFSKDIIFDKVYEMSLATDDEKFVSGMTSFDKYSYWHNGCTFGINTVCPDGIVSTPGAPVYMSEQERVVLSENITQNVISLAKEYKDVDFYYFFTPYSIVWWNEQVNEGTIYKQIEAEKYIIESALAYDNIHLYSFNNCTDIITDLNNYKDYTHYAEWINSMILRWMRDGEHRLTKENYIDYLKTELEFFTTFDYTSINNQIDYEKDVYAAALLNEEYKGVTSMDLLNSEQVEILLSNAEMVEGQYDGSVGIKCTGRLQREPESEQSVADYVKATEYIGAKIHIEEWQNYDYLAFYGKKVADHGQPTVYVYNEQLESIASFELRYPELDNEWHQYVLELPSIEGNTTIIFNGGYTDNTGKWASEYVFSEMRLF